MPHTLELDRPCDGVVVVRLNRPERLNAIDEVMQSELGRALADLAAAQATRAIVLTGAGRGFCAGIDMRDFGPNVPEATAPALDRMRFQEGMAALPRHPQTAATRHRRRQRPLRRCGPRAVPGRRHPDLFRAASFGNAAILLGLSGAEMGMSYHLPRIVGTSVAADWMLTGRTVPADEADRRGLVSELVEPDRFVDRAVELAAR